LPTQSALGEIAIKAALTDAGYDGMTFQDQLGIVTSVINAIIGVLNAFGVIALIAAGFGIINTLLMSVQERTREIGLMKSMGMSRGRLFALFSSEAIFIGLLGSALGAVAAIALGTVISTVIASGPLAALAGLRIIAFDPAAVTIVVLLVMTLSFLAGTLPAARAARLDPIDALRYE
jgi:putative ABC transport system permease protein